MRRPSSFFPLALLFLMSLTSIPHPGWSIDRTVPDPYPEIEDALLDASPATHDRILVSHRVEDYLPFTLDKAVPVIGVDELPVVVWGEGYEFAARITSGGGVIDGLTLQGGSTTVVELGPGEIRNCTIRDLGESYDRGLVKALAGAGRVTHCTFQRTSTASNAMIVIDLQGGGVEISDCTFTAPGSLEDQDHMIELSTGASGDVEIHDCTFTFTSSYSSGAAIGLLSNSGVIEDNLFACPDKAIVCSGAAGTMSRNVIRITGTGGAGIILDSEAGSSLEQNTIVDDAGGFCTGVWIVDTLGGHLIQRNLLADMATGIFYAPNLFPDEIHHNIYSGTGDSDNMNLSSTQIADKEALFCESHAGNVQEFTQRIDSEAAPGNNGWGELIGARDVECAWGTLARNTSMSSGTVTVLEDVIVPSGRSMTLGAGVTCRFDLYDNSTSGSDQWRNELTIQGSLTTNGTAQDPVRFVSLAASPAEGDWYGISAANATGLSLSGAEVRHAVYGLLARAAGSYTVGGCTFAENAHVDLYGANAGGAEPTIQGNTFTVGGGTGIHLLGGIASGLISENVVECDSETSIGIANQSCSAAYSENTITGASMGDGIRISGGSPTFLMNTLSGNLRGIQVNGGTPQIGDDPQEENFITENCFGIYVNASGCTFGPVTIRGNLIAWNEDSGVFADGTHNVDLGTSSQDPGNNNISHNTNNVWNDASSCGTLLARGNYIEGCDQDPLTYGLVDIVPRLCTPPASRGVAVEPVPEAAPLVVHGLWPNPVREAATVELSLGAPAAELMMEVFDLNGRLVQRMVVLNRPAGEQELSWTGTDRSGRPVPGGIYFVRVSADGTHRASVKALVAR